MKLTYTMVNEKKNFWIKKPLAIEGLEESILSLMSDPLCDILVVGVFDDNAQQVMHTGNLKEIPIEKRTGEEGDKWFWIAGEPGFREEPFTSFAEGLKYAVDIDWDGQLKHLKSYF